MIIKNGETNFIKYHHAHNNCMFICALDTYPAVYYSLQRVISVGIERPKVQAGEGRGKRGKEGEGWDACESAKCPFLLVFLLPGFGKIYSWNSDRGVNKRVGGGSRYRKGVDGWGVN